MTSRFSGPRTLALCDTGADRVELARCPDQTLAIRRNGHLVGTWPPDRIDDCFEAFTQLAGLNPRGLDEPGLIVLLRRPASERGPADERLN